MCHQELILLGSPMFGGTGATGSAIVNTLGQIIGVAINGQDQDM